MPQVPHGARPVDSVGNVGFYTSMLVVSGNPAIGYYDNSTFDLKYVRAADVNGAAWGAPVTLDSIGNVGLFGSMAIVNGNPAIGYYDATLLDLKFVRANDGAGTTWGTPVAVDTVGNVGRYRQRCGWSDEHHILAEQRDGFPDRDDGCDDFRERRAE